MALKVTRRGDLIIIGDDLARVEPGPARKSAKATKELLDDSKTHSRYFVGVRNVDQPDGSSIQMKGRDAQHREIVIGQPMEYLDYRADPVLYVYRRRSLSAEEQLARGGGADHVFEVDSTYSLDAEASAIARAQAIASGE